MYCIVSKESGLYLGSIDADGSCGVCDLDSALRFNSPYAASLMQVAFCLFIDQDLDAFYVSEIF